MKIKREPVISDEEFAIAVAIYERVELLCQAVKRRGFNVQIIVNKNETTTKAKRRKGK